MSDDVTAGRARPGDGPGALRILALVAVGIGLAALAGAAFVLSYSGVHAFALQAGVSPKLARGYPLIFDVLLVIILAAVLALRGAGLPSKFLAWTCLIAVLAAAAGADAMHAAGRKLPHQSAAVTAAVVPWVLVLIALALLLAMLRHARQRRLGEGSRWQPQERPPRSTAPLVPGFDWAPAVTTPEAVRDAEPAAMASVPAGPPAETLRSGPNDTLRLAVPRLTVPRQVTAATAVDASPVEASTVEAGPVEASPVEASPADVGPGGTDADGPAAAGTAETESSEEAWTEDDPADLDASDGPAPDEHAAAEHETEGPEREPVAVTASARAEAGDGDDPGTDPEMPVFHRMWSAPTPPDSPAG
jgi:Protein of unknown function (DUF2637)